MVAKMLYIKAVHNLCSPCANDITSSLHERSPKIGEK